MRMLPFENDTFSLTLNASYTNSGINNILKKTYRQLSYISLKPEEFIHECKDERRRDRKEIVEER